jgi:hypothetical protein
MSSVVWVDIPHNQLHTREGRGGGGSRDRGRGNGRGEGNTMKESEFRSRGVSRKDGNVWQGRGRGKETREDGVIRNDKEINVWQSRGRGKEMREEGGISSRSDEKEMKKEQNIRKPLNFNIQTECVRYFFLSLPPSTHLLQLISLISYNSHPSTHLLQLFSSYIR